MTLLILGLALIVLILIITLSAICKHDTSELEITVIRPWKFSIKLKKDKPHKSIHKNQKE